MIKIKTSRMDMTLDIPLNCVSDDYHNIEELYDHRIALMVALMNCNKTISWWSKKHFDGSSFENWIIVGMRLPTGDITYHIPEYYAFYLKNIQELEKGVEWDGHTSEKVLDRLLDFAKL